MLRALEIPEPELAEVIERDVAERVGGEITGGGGDEGLAAGGHTGDPRRPDDIEAVVAGLARVNADAEVNCRSVGPASLRHGLLQLDRPAHGIAGTAERIEECVGLGVDRLAAVPPERVADEDVVLREHGRIEARGTLDVREEERRRAGRRPARGRPGRRRRERLVLLEDRPLEPAQLLTGLEPELLVEQPAAGLIDGERVRLAPAPVEGDHQLAAEALPQRMPADEPLQLRDELGVPAELEIGVDALLECGNALLFEAGALGARERCVELGERRPAPERERLAEHIRRLGRRLVPRPCDGGLEAIEIELALAHPNQVAAGLGDDRVAAERLAELRDVHLNRGRGGLGRLLAPELVDQALTRDGLVRVQEQKAEEAALLGACDLEAVAVVLDLEGAEDPEVHVLF